MDLTSLGVGLLSGIVVGLVIEAFTGWLAHRLSLDRSRAERRVEDETAQIDRCADIFAARVAYVVAWHRKGRWQELKEERLALERRNPTDIPEVVLAGTEEWEAYKEAEGRLRWDKVKAPPDRVVEIETFSADVQRLIAERRAAARS